MPKHYSRSDKILRAAALVTAMLDVAQARGALRAKLLRGTGIFEEDLHADFRLSAQQLLTLINNVQVQTKSRDTAFQTGKSLASSHLPVLFSALGACSNLTDAMRVVAVRRTVFTPLLSVHRLDSNDSVLFILEDAIGCGKAWPFVVEMFLSLWVSLCKLWCAQRLPFYFEFPTPRPRQIQEFEEHLGYRLSFNAPWFGVRVARDVLHTPFVAHSPFYRSIMWEKVQTEPAIPFGLLDFIRWHVRRAPGLSQDEMAAILNISTATLKRKLTEHQSSFRALTDETRKTQAVHLLAVKKMTNEQSALRMAFSDLTNFRRAVKRWTGQTPSELRQVN